MTFDGQALRAPCHGLRTVVAVALGALSTSVLPAAAPSAAVVGLESTRVADIVLVVGGFDAGLRQGMVCRVTRGSTDIGEILLVDLRPSCSAALILSIAPRQSIRPGDFATVKVLKS